MAVLPSAIIGHEAPRAQLLSDIDSSNVAHAYLFSGPAHIGKMTIAKWFARELLCTDQDPETCMSIREQMSKLIHPDYLVLDELWMEEKQENWDAIALSSNVPQQHRQKKRARTNTISIDDIRALQERLNETGSTQFFCCLIRSIERLQDTAANAFLKILEEPPPRAVFILTTEAHQSLLPTLISRTRTVLFQPLSQKEVKPLLESAHDDDQAFISHLAQGAPGRIIRLINDPELLREEKQIHAQAMRFWQMPSLHEKLKWLTQYSEKGADMDSLMLHLGLALREHLAQDYKDTWVRAYMKLASSLHTNAHKGLLLEQFALAVSAP